jgi:hypothetical protein
MVKYVINFVFVPSASVTFFVRTNTHKAGSGLDWTYLASQSPVVVSCEQRSLI